MYRDLPSYFEDRWHIFDVLGLVLLSAGSIARRVDSSSHWGQAFYALSAPLMISRILFFAQIFRFQGPMINVSVSYPGHPPFRDHDRWMALDAVLATASVTVVSVFRGT